MFDYLLTTGSGFGAPEWVFFIAQIVLAIGGLYLAFIRTDTNQIRATALRRLGYGLLILGIVGVIVGTVRLTTGLPPYMFTIVTIFEGILAGYALFYAQTTYASQIAAQEQIGRAKGNRPSGKSNSPRQETMRPMNPRKLADDTATTDANEANTSTRQPSSRRESRRDRKRRSR